MFRMCMPANTVTADRALVGAERRERYRAVTIRVAEPFRHLCVQVARDLGWQQADLLRTLVSIGATFSFLAGQDANRVKAATDLLGGLKLMAPWSGYGRGGRPYATRLRGRDSELVTISLPRSLCELVGIYAEMHDASRNETYCKLLQRGLIAFAEAQASLLKSFRETEEPPKASSH